MDRWMDGWMDGRMDRWMYIHTYIHPIKTYTSYNDVGSQARLVMLVPHASPSSLVVFKPRSGTLSWFVLVRVGSLILAASGFNPGPLSDLSLCISYLIPTSILVLLLLLLWQLRGWLEAELLSFVRPRPS
jgi:hypothetical protein